MKALAESQHAFFAVMCGLMVVKGRYEGSSICNRNQH